MSIFSDIVNKIFHRAKPAALSDIDVAEGMDQLASENAQKLNWHTLIVDLMKLLGVDSSLNHRKQLATELKYSGDMNDSASINIWLHKQLMQATHLLRHR
ncbi:hypothetical protein BPMI_00613 [Candidatus Burkholderia pumila]|uniref:DUF3597 domain-containing protein n=1 Tax=Candidatus Burkholderia pumila TaxID=1090375 RepID=A0ABR5HKJ2_9BURK|nr:hypothetical protein BPMI_00613 [Candidatus Burkholderia pumila]